MKAAEITQAGTDLLIQAYRGAASAHGETSDLTAANESADLVAAIYGELRRRGIEHQTRLLPLLSDRSMSVRAWSAAHALEFAAVEGEAMLQELTSASWPVGFNAKVTLEEWRAGRLRFP